MAERSAGSVVRQFFQDLEDALRGQPVNPYGAMSDDVEFTVTGQTPLSGTWKGMASLMAEFMPEADRRMGRGPAHGLYPIEFIEEGDKVVVIAKGRSSNLEGIPYNNTYFLFFEVRAGRIVRYIEDFDSSHAWQVIFDCHLEEAKG